MTGFIDQHEHSYFDQRDQKYMCFCGRVHCKVAIHIAMAIELIILIFNFVLNAAFYGATVKQHHDTGVGYVVYAAIMLLIGVVVNVLLYFGVRDDKPAYLMPHFVASFLALVAFFSYVVVLIIVLIVLTGPSPASGKERASPRNYSVEAWVSIQMVINFLLVPFEFWILSLIRTCSNYIRDQRSHLTLIGEPRVIYGSLKDTITF